MTERSARPSAQNASRSSPHGDSSSQKQGKQPKQKGQKQSGQKGSAPQGQGQKQSGQKGSAPSRPAPTEPPRGPDDTAIRPGLAERVQAKLSAAADEHKVNAVPDRQPSGSGAARPRGPRRARLRVTRVDPWSVMKTAFLLSIAFGVVTVVAVAMVWQVLGAAGVWDSINSTIQEIVNNEDSRAIDVEDYVGTSRVLGFTMLVAAVDVILLTAIATLGAFLYNMAAALLGGVEVTMAEDQH